MADKGKTITNKISGESITWLETAKNSNGRRLSFKMAVKPKGTVAVRHIHPNQDETFEIKTGLVKVQYGDKVSLLKPGDKLTVPKGVPHQWWNDSSDETVELVVTFEPALNTEIFLEQFFGLSNDDKLNADGSPPFLQIMTMVNKYDIYVAGPPIFLQKIMSMLLGGIARLFGYRGYARKYSSSGL